MRINSLLDSRYQYFLIEVAFGKGYLSYKDFDTLRLIKNSARTLLLDSIILKELQQNGLVWLPLKKYEDIQIIWMDYKENYFDDSRPNKLSVEDILNDDDDDENGIFELPVKIFNMNEEARKNMHNTPWGQFAKDDMHSPLNMYDLQIAHLKGFNIEDVNNIEHILSNVNGVAKFHILDRYAIIIAPAKAYSTSEVKLNVQHALYHALGFDEEVYAGIEEDTWCKKSKELFDSGKENYILLLPNGQAQIIYDMSSESEQKILSLIKTVENVIVVKNGEFYEVNGN